MTSMPKTAQEILSTVETQILDGIRRSQDAVVKAVRGVAEAGKGAAPALRPIAGRLPAAKLVDHGFVLADRVLANQREFALALIKAVEPVLGTKRSKSSSAAAPIASARPKAATAKQPAAATA
jgi:hypothetical protein